MDCLPLPDECSMVTTDMILSNYYPNIIIIIIIINIIIIIIIIIIKLLIFFSLSDYLTISHVSVPVRVCDGGG